MTGETRIREPRIENRRLHPVGMLLGALGAIRRFIGAAVVPGVAVLVNQGVSTRVMFFLALGAVVLVIGSAIWGVLSWRATTYSVADGTFRLKRGVVQKSERSLPLERVQSVSTVQGIVQRIFGVVEVRVETAGGGGEPEISLPALSRPAVETLREELTERRSPEPSDTETPEGEEVGRGTGEGTAEPEVVRRLGARALLVAGLTSGQIGVALSVVAVASQVFDNFLPENLARRVLEYLSPDSIAVAVLFALAIGLAAWGLAILGTVLAHAGFTLSRSADGRYLKIQRGLLERHEATVPLSRIQAIRVIDGVLRQPFGLAEVRLESAGFGDEQGVSTTLFPLLPRKDVEKLLRDVAPEFAAPLSELEALPVRARRRYVLRAVLVAAVPVAFIVLQSAAVVGFGLTVYLLSLLLIPAGLYGWLRFRSAGWRLEEGRVILRYRLLARTTAIAPRHRLQTRNVSSSPFQRRRRLASFRIEVASGSGGSAFGLTDLDSSTAGKLLEELSSYGRRPLTRPE